MIELNALSLAIVPIVLALVQACKTIGLDGKFAPFLAIVLGGVLYGFQTGQIVGAIMPGVVIGLSASGLFSGSKSFIGK